MKAVTGYVTPEGFYCLTCFHKKGYLDRLEILKTFLFKTTDDQPYPFCEEIDVCVDCGQEFSTRVRTVLTK